MKENVKDERSGESMDTTLNVTMKIKHEDKKTILKLAGERQGQTGKKTYVSTIVRELMLKGLTCQSSK